MPLVTAPAIIVRGDQIKQYSERAGLTTKTALARATGVDASTIGRLLAGRTEPSARFMFQLARVLNARVEDLFAQAQA